MFAGCGVRLDGPPQSTPDGTQATPDAPIVGADAPVDALMLGPWGTPAKVLGASSTAGEDDGTLSSNGLEMVFAIQDPNANNTKDLWYMQRASQASPWSTPQRLPFNITGVSDETPRFSADDKTLFFASGRAGGLGGLDIYRVSRPAAGSTTWGLVETVPGVSTAGTDKWFMPCAQNNTYLTILGNDIGEGTIGSAPVVSNELSSPTGTETGTFLSPDCLTAYFASTRSGTNRIWVSTRTSIGATWSTPTMVQDFPMGNDAQEDPWISADLKTFVFVSNASGSKDVYISTR